MKYVPGTKIEKPVVQLTDDSGNAFVIIANVRRALKRAGCPAHVIEEYSKKATSGNYDHVLQVSFDYAECE